MRKLYYEDSSIRNFTAQVAACREVEGGFEVELDETAFYPEGGGQACDIGFIGEAKVTDVRQRGETVVHLCDRQVQLGEVVCRVDWERRFDLMQQHTGEHIVSGVIHSMFGFQNVGFHVGSDVMTVDFDGMLTEEQLKDVELRANQAVWEDIALRCWIPDPKELETVTYRTKRALPWPVRIVQIPGIDSCACCGVHTQTTGQVGVIKLFNCVKFHGGARIEMACGKRALALLNHFYEENRQVSQAFSAKATQTGEAARYMNEQLAQEKFRANGLQRQVFGLKAKEYAGKELAVCFEEALDGAGVRAYAEELAQVCKVGAVFSEDGKGGYQLCLAGEEARVRELGAALAKTLGARGGGKPGFYQGSVMADREKIRGVLQEICP